MKRAYMISKNKRGFTLVEVLIAMVILMIGLLAGLALFGAAMSATQFAQQDLIARQKAREALEAVYAVRNNQQQNCPLLGPFPAAPPYCWAQILNDSVANGVYKTGWDNLYRVPLNSNNQVLGTASEGNQLDYELLPDNAGNLNQQVALTNFQRQIQILAIPAAGPNLRQVIVSVRYAINGGQFRTYTVNGLISQF